MTVAVSPEDIGKDIHVVVIYDGVTVKCFDYSVVDYCNAVFNAQTNAKQANANDTTYDALADLCEALLEIMKDKKIYEEPTMDVITFEGKDIIATSGEHYDNENPPTPTTTAFNMF